MVGIQRRQFGTHQRHATAIRARFISELVASFHFIFVFLLDIVR
jgi:hypothetical protein